MEPLHYFAASTALIDPDVTIGSGTKVWNFSHISSGAKIGENCIIGDHVFIGQDVHIGDGCKLQNGVFLPKGVVLANNVFIGPGTVFTNVVNPRAFIERKNEFQDTIICEGVSIGANCTILCGIIILDYALIGAGSVVTTTIDAFRVAVGNPAKVVAKVDQDGSKISYQDI